MDNHSDLAAERAVLTGIFAFGDECYSDIAPIVTANTFTNESNALIWKCAEHILRNEPSATIDVPSIMSAASSMGQANKLEATSEKQYLRAIIGSPIKQETVRRMAGRIRKLEIFRLLNGQLDEAKLNILGATGDEPLSKVFAMAEEPIFNLTSLLTDNGGGGIRRMGDGGREYMIHLMDNPRDMIGISTGFEEFDRAIGGGCRENSLDVIAARPKTGKSFLVDNFGINISGQQIPVFNIDTEMNWEEHLHRITAAIAGVDIEDIETGKCGKLSRRQVLDATDYLNTLPFYYESVLDKSFEEILASLRRWMTRTVGLDENGKLKPCVVIYDYLKMLSADFATGNMAEYQALGFVTTALKNLMGRYRGRCICFAQLNREGIDREDSSVISGSDRIIHYCTSFSIYKKKTEDERIEAMALAPEAKYFTHKLMPIIGRHGAGLADGDYINIGANYKQGKLTEGPTKYQLANGWTGKNRPNRGHNTGFTINESDADVDCQLEL